MLTRLAVVAILHADVITCHIYFPREVLVNTGQSQVCKHGTEHIQMLYASNLRDHHYTWYDVSSSMRC